MAYKNKELEKATRKKWRLENPHYQKKWRLENPHYQKKWLENHPGYMKLKNQEFLNNHPEYMRNFWRKHYLHRKSTGAEQARWKVKQAIKTNKLVSLKSIYISCSDCLVERATVYDHRDYSKPLNVVPLCHPCNLKRGAGVPICK